VIASGRSSGPKMGVPRRTSFWRGIPSDWARVVKGMKRRMIRMIGMMDFLVMINASFCFLARISRITLFLLDRICWIFRILLFSQFPDGIEKDRQCNGRRWCFCCFMGQYLPKP
jgi:hypothetical protein